MARRDYAHGVSDFDELSGRLRSVASDLEDVSGRLRSASEAAQGRDFRAGDPGGLAEVTVDGRPRVTAVSLHPDALRAGPDGLDQLLTGLINGALTQARAVTRQALFDALPELVRAEVENATTGHQS